MGTSSHQFDPEHPHDVRGLQGIDFQAFQLPIVVGDHDTRDLAGAQIHPLERRFKKVRPDEIRLSKGQALPSVFRKGGVGIVTAGDAAVLPAGAGEVCIAVGAALEAGGFEYAVAEIALIHPAGGQHGIFKKGGAKPAAVKPALFHPYAGKGTAGEVAVGHGASDEGAVLKVEVGAVGIRQLLSLIRTAPNSFLLGSGVIDIPPEHIPTSFPGDRTIFYQVPSGIARESRP